MADPEFVNVGEGVPIYAQIETLEGWLIEGLSEWDLARDPQDTHWTIPEDYYTVLRLVRNRAKLSYTKSSMLLLKAGYNLMKRDICVELKNLNKVVAKLDRFELATGYRGKPKLELGLANCSNQRMRVYIPHWLYPELVDKSFITGIQLKTYGRLLFAYAIANSSMAILKYPSVVLVARRDILEFGTWVRAYIAMGAEEQEKADLVWDGVEALLKRKVDDDKALYSDRLYKSKESMTFG